MVAIPFVAIDRVVAAAPLASCNPVVGPLMVQMPLLPFTTVTTVPIGKATDALVGTVTVLVDPVFK
jgi:hypothetical protein